MPDRCRSLQLAVAGRIYDVDELETSRLFHEELFRLTGLRQTTNLFQILQVAKSLYLKDHPEPHPPITDYIISNEEREAWVAQLDAADERAKLQIV